MTWLSGYSKRKELVLMGGASGALSDFQLSIAVSYAAAMQGDFDDLRFTQSNGTTKIDAWLETKTDDTSATVWVEFPTTPANTVEQDYYMYYGNGSAVSDWSGDNTFLQYHGSSTTAFLDSLIALPSSYAYENRIRSTSSSDIQWGLGNVSGWADDTILLQNHSPGNARYVRCTNEGAHTTLNETPSLTNNIWYHGLITFDGTTAYGYIDGNQITASGLTTNLPNENMGLKMTFTSGSGGQDWSFVRKYASGPPTYAFGSEESAPTGHPTMRRWGGTPGMQYTGRRSW